jgi:biopolymer transport protein ExbD
MPIVLPGRRPARRFQASKILGGKMQRRRRSTNADLNVVPMVDMMTMLVIFLLMQFSATGEVLYIQKDIKLPDARHGQAIEVAPVVAISASQIVVSGQKVAEVADVERSEDFAIPGLEERLRDEKKRWDFIHQNDPDRDRNWKGDVNIQADTKVPFRILKRVMYTAGQAGYFNVNFATLDQSNVQAVNKVD